MLVVESRSHHCHQLELRCGLEMVEDPNAGEGKAPGSSIDCSTSSQSNERPSRKRSHSKPCSIRSPLGVRHIAEIPKKKQDQYQFELRQAARLRELPEWPV